MMKEKWIPFKKYKLLNIWEIKKVVVLLTFKKKTEDLHAHTKPTYLKCT